MGNVKVGRVATVVIAHKDRLARFGYDDLAHEAETAGCEILVANQESLSPREEMMQDLLAIVDTFSGRLHGQRRYEKQLNAADLTEVSS
ncbi:recombinase family protein [Micromonospora cremea]|uniref:recombinase family protein n=1 Tax=Micromonospora cremea TaxID=709881 RepID=UPI001180CEDF|nr:recombinase family protein [Micromonospora cremea]